MSWRALLYFLLALLTNAFECHELDRNSANIVSTILNEFQSLGYSQVTYEGLIEPVWTMLSGHTEHFNSHCVNSLLNYYKNSPMEIWTNEQNSDISSEKLINDIIIICRELPGWQNICDDSSVTSLDLIASDLHFATTFYFENEKKIKYDLPVNLFCNVIPDISDKTGYIYDFECPMELLKIVFPTENEPKIEIKDSIIICSSTTFWSDMCKKNDITTTLPEINFLASSLYFQLVNNKDKYSLNLLNIGERISPTDFCDIAINMSSKGDIMKYFNSICISELSTHSKSMGSGLFSQPMNNVIEICSNNPLWISCNSNEIDESEMVENISVNPKLAEKITKKDIIDLLATTILYELHNLSIFMFSSKYYQFAKIEDTCIISILIQREADEILLKDKQGIDMNIGMGPFFNSICWRVLSTYKIKFNTGIGIVTHPIKTLEAITVCKSSILFWTYDCVSETHEEIIYSPQISILSQELLLGSTKYYNLPKNTFCNASKRIIKGLRNLNDSLGSFKNDVVDFSINWLIDNIHKSADQPQLSGISSGFFNRECVRELLGENEKNSEFMPIHFAIDICSNSLRWERCFTHGSNVRIPLAEFIASEFQYGLVAEFDVYNSLGWSELCSISISISHNHNSLNSAPNLPFFNHECSFAFLNNFQQIRRDASNDSNHGSYEFTRFIKLCVHNYFWRTPCDDLIELDLLANSLYYGYNQFELVGDIQENSFCNVGRKLLDLDPERYSNECIRELMNLSNFFTSEVAEGSCSVTHRFLACHGYPEEYTTIASTLFTAMFQYFPKVEIPNFIEFCSIIHSIYTDIEIQNSPHFFNAICAKHIHSSNLGISFKDISFLCNQISRDTVYDEDFSVSVLASEFYKTSKTINSLKKWEIRYFYPVAKRLWEHLKDEESSLFYFNSVCVTVIRSVISTDSFKLRLDDAVSLCSGSVAYRTYCVENKDKNLQHLVSEIIQGLKITKNIGLFSDEDIKSICNASILIYNLSVERIPISRDNTNLLIKYPYFLNSCVDILNSGIILTENIFNVSLEDAITICTQSSRSSIPCKNDKTLVSVLAVGLFSEMKFFPEFSDIHISDLCNISSKLVDQDFESYMESCLSYFNNYKFFIPNTGNLKNQLTYLQKQKICTGPYKWKKCRLGGEYVRDFYSVKLEAFASRISNIFTMNGLDIWNFEKFCSLAEELLKSKETTKFKSCIKALDNFIYIDMIKKKSSFFESPLLLHYELEEQVVQNICNQITLDNECVTSSNQLSSIISSDFYSISTKYLDLDSIKSSDFCIISEILMQKGSLEEIKRICPQILTQITNLEHWPPIMLTPELATIICSDLEILNLNCKPEDKKNGITKLLSEGITDIAIELFFFRRKYVPSFNPESSCNVAEVLIQLGIRNVYFKNACVNFFSYDIWNFSQNTKSKYNYLISQVNDPETLFATIKKEAENICNSLELKLSNLYVKSHNILKKKDHETINNGYKRRTIRKIFDQFRPNNVKSGMKNYTKLTKREERAILKKKLMIISRAKGYVKLTDDVIRDYGPEHVDKKLAEKYFAEFPKDAFSISEGNNVEYEPPVLDWDAFSKSLAYISNKMMGVTINVSDPKNGGLSSLVHKWGYLPRGTIQGAQYIYRISRYINKYMISPKKAYLIWKETLISMNHSILPKWRESWAEEIRKPNPQDEQPSPSCEGIKSNKILKQLGMDRKKISIVAISNIDSFVTQLTEAAHDLNLLSVKFNDLCVVGIILFNLKSYSRTESFNYQCTKWVREVGHIENTEVVKVNNSQAFSKKMANNLKNGMRKQIPSELARKICASTSRWMSCNGGSNIDEKLRIDSLATEFVRLSRIKGIEFRDMCEISIQIGNSQNFNQRCPLLLQPIIGSYNRALHVCKSTSFWKSCRYSKNTLDLKLLEHLDILSLELTLGLNEIFPNISTFEEMCHIADKFVVSDFFKHDCVSSIANYLIDKRYLKPTLSIYGETKPSTSFKHIVSVASNVCYDTLRWQHAVCSLDNDENSLIEKQWIDLVSEELLRKMMLIRKNDSRVALFFKDIERDLAIEKFNLENKEGNKIVIPKNIKYNNVCKQVSKISKTRYFNIDCIRTVSEIFQVQVSEIDSTLSNLEYKNIYTDSIKIPSPNTIEEICKGSIFWETCSNQYTRSLNNLVVGEDNKSKVDIIVNDIMVSILQIDDNDVKPVPDLDELSDTKEIYSHAIKTINSLGYLDFCIIGDWYSKEIANFNGTNYSKLQNSLSDEITNLILKNMYPDIPESKHVEDEEVESELGTLEEYIEKSISELPEILPELVTPPVEFLKNSTNITSILIQHSRYYDKNEIYMVRLSNNELFFESFLSRNVSNIYGNNSHSYLYVKPISGLKLQMFQLPDGSYDYPFLVKKRTDDGYLGDAMKAIENEMKIYPEHFHKSVVPHATVALMRKTQLSGPESKIKKKWLKSITEEYYYKRGMKFAKEEWEMRELAESNSDNKTDITWKTRQKEKVPNAVSAFFSTNARKRRREGRLSDKGMYKARVHQFLLQKLISSQKEQRSKREGFREVLINKTAYSKFKYECPAIYGDLEISVVSSLASLIAYNQIAVDLLVD
ncbi:large cysteine rich [Cryptosporidium xiaoi]|uniref:Large cysteine rich n=1 Tax=Cryptosporidium xiaoi TaxID=659607 RepID=A0AAV9XXE1_9CRYT